MKKLISLILVVLLLCMALPAFAEEEVTGDWYLKTMKMDDQEYDAASIGYAITMTLNEDGTVIMVVPDREPTAGTWVLEGDKITVNLPMGLVKVGIAMGMTMPQINGKEALEGIDLEQVMKLVEAGLVGEIVTVDSADGDHVRIFVE